MDIVNKFYLPLLFEGEESFIGGYQRMPTKLKVVCLNLFVLDNYLV